MADRLNWGCGPDVRPGWVNSDRVDYGQDHVGDITAGLPWPDAHFEYAVTNHALQMLAHPDLVPALREIRRVLRPGGVLRVLAPDLLAAIDAWEALDASHFMVADAIEADLDGKFCVYITQAGSTRSVFTHTYLDQLLRRAGFSSSRHVMSGETRTCWPDIVTLDSRPRESIIREAIA